MENGEYLQPAQGLPQGSEATASGDLAPTGPPAADAENPLVAGDLRIELVGDLATVQGLHAELSSWLQQRLSQHVGNLAVRGDGPVTLNYSHIDHDGALPAFEHLDDDAEDLQRRLDTSIRDVLLQMGVEESPLLEKWVRTYGTEGVHNLRDVLVVGRKEVRTIHQKAGALIRDALKEILPEEPWHTYPDIEQAARICSDLSQVTSAAAGCALLGWSVEDLLNRSRDDLVDAWAWKVKFEGWHEYSLEELVGESPKDARSYADKFTAEQARQRALAEGRDAIHYPAS